MKNLENIQGLEQLPPILNEDWLEKAIKKLDESAMTPEERMLYEMSLAKNASIIAMRREEDRIKKEANTKEIAKKLKDNGTEIEIIAKSTGLTMEEIENL